jgi:hypothetical protein
VRGLGVILFVSGGFTNLVGHEINQGIIFSRIYSRTQKSRTKYGVHGYSLSYGFSYARISYLRPLRMKLGIRDWRPSTLRSFCIRVRLNHGPTVCGKRTVVGFVRLSCWADMRSCIVTMPGNKIPWLATLSGFVDTRVPERQPLVHVRPQCRKFANASASFETSYLHGI